MEGGAGRWPVDLPGFVVRALIRHLGGAWYPGRFGRLGATELPAQEERVRRGFFPANPGRRRRDDRNDDDNPPGDFVL